MDDTMMLDDGVPLYCMIDEGSDAKSIVSDIGPGFLEYATYCVTDENVIPDDDGER
jgi:hypothetical protein